LNNWLISWVVSWAIMLPAVLFAAPVIQFIVVRLTCEDRAGETRRAQEH
jgi:hypothetical protein